MRILVLSWRDPRHPLAGGAEQVMHEHMKGWVKAGHEVTLFSSHFGNVRKKETIDDIQIIRKGGQLLGVHIGAFFWYIFGKHDKYDFVVDQFHFIPFFTPLYIRKPKIAVLQEIAKSVWLKNPLPKPYNVVLGSIGYMIEPIIFLLYRKTKFITGSQSAKQDLARIMKIPANNITVIPHGVIIQRPRPFPKKETVKTVIYLGALAKDKGVEDALVAFSLLNRQEEYQFWVVGKPESEVYFERLKGMVKKSGLDRKLKFWGFVSQEKKFDLLARAHLMINPSVHEGFGLVNIEANAMGTPVVAYRSQGLIDSVKDGVSGIIVDKNSPEALVRVISELIQSENYGEYCMGSVRWSKRFNWDKSKEQSLKLIESLGYS